MTAGSAAGRRALWLGMGAAAAALELAPGAGLAPASGWPLGYVWLGLARLVLVLPILAAGLGLAPVLLARLDRGLSAAALGATVAPLAWAAIAAAVLAGGGDFASAGRTALAIAGVLALVMAWLGPRAHPAPVDAGAVSAGGHRRFGLAALLWIGGLVGLFCAVPALAYRSDAWFHAAVTYRMDLLGWPPDDPYYVGLPLGYFWAFHLALGTLAGAAGVTPFAAGAAVSVLAATAVALWLGALARRLCSERAMMPALVLAVVGLNPLGWLWWLSQGLLGSHHGPGILARAWQGGPMVSMEAISVAYPHVSAGYFLDKFLLVTAFGLGYAAVLAFAWVLVRSGEARPWRPLAASALAAAVGLYLHGVAGVALVLAGAGALGAALVLLGGLRRMWPIGAGLALAGLAALPYERLCASAKVEPSARLALQPDMAWTWLGSGGFLLALALPEMARWWRERRADPERMRLAFAWLALALLSLVVTMMGRNETKLMNLGALLLAVPAAGGWVRAARTRARVPARIVLWGLCVPTFLLGLSGFAGARGQDVLGSMSPGAADAEVFQWLAAHAERRAAVLEAPRDEAGHVSLDALVHGRRGLAWGGPEYIVNWGYPPRERDARLSLVRALAQGEFSPRMEAELMRLQMQGASEFYFLSRRSGMAAGGDSASTAKVGPAGGLPGPWEAVFTNPEVTVFRYGGGVPQLAAAASR